MDEIIKITSNIKKGITYVKFELNKNFINIEYEMKNNNEHIIVNESSSMAITYFDHISNVLDLSSQNFEESVLLYKEVRKYFREL